MSFNLRKFFKNLGYLFSVNMLSSALLFFQGIVLVRYLGTENYGVWSLARSLPGMLFVLADLGLNSLILREIAHQPSRQRTEHFFSNALVMKIYLSAAFVLVLAGVLTVFDYSRQVAVLVMLSAISYIVVTFAEIVIVLFKAREDFKWQAIYTFVQTAGIFIIVILNVFFKSSVFAILLSIAIFQAILFLVFMILAVRLFKFNLQDLMPFSQQLALLKKAIPFALIGIMSNFFYEVDTVMLSKMAHYSDVGIFNAANRLIHALIMFPLFFGQVLFPSLSYMYKNDFRKFVDVVLSFEKYIIILMLPFCVLFYRFADVVILALFGDKYAAAIAPLKILSFALLFYFLAVSFTVALNAGHLEKKVALILSIAATVKIILNFILIPRFTFIGASISAVAGEMIRSGGAILFFSVFLKYRLKWISLWRVSLVLLPLLVFLFRFHGIPGYLLYLLSLVVYVLLLFKAGLISIWEIKLAWQRFLTSEEAVLQPGDLP